MIADIAKPRAAHCLSNASFGLSDLQTSIARIATFLGYEGFVACRAVCVNSLRDVPRTEKRDIATQTTPNQWLLMDLLYVHGTRRHTVIYYDPSNAFNSVLTRASPLLAIFMADLPVVVKCEDTAGMGQ